MLATMMDIWAQNDCSDFADLHKSEAGPAIDMMISILYQHKIIVRILSTYATWKLVHLMGLWRFIYTPQYTIGTTKAMDAMKY